MLTDTVDQLTKPDFSDLSYFSGHVLSKTKSVTLNFFAFLAIVYHYLSAWQVKKISAWELFGLELLKIRLKKFFEV